MRKIAIILCLFLLIISAGKGSAAERMPLAQLARQQYLRGDVTKAIESYDKALIASPKDKKQLAIKDFDEAIRKVPNYGEAFYERSLIYKSMGRKSLAEGDLQKAKFFGYKAPEAMR